MDIQGVVPSMLVLVYTKYCNLLEYVAPESFSKEAVIEIINASMKTFRSLLQEMLRLLY